MKFDGFPGEKTILSYKLANGVGWLTTHRLIIQQEAAHGRKSSIHNLTRNMSRNLHKEANFTTG